METRAIRKPKIKTWKIDLNQTWCKGCNLCIKICPVEGIFTEDEEIGKKGFKPIIVNPKGCTGCMLCELLCPDLAITVEEE